MKFFYEKYDPQLPTVLCSSSDQFNRDIQMLQLLGTRFNWVAVSDKKLADAQPWVPERLRTQALYVNEESAEATEVWARSREAGLQILADVRTEMPTLAAVMAGNWDYWNEECLRLACKQTNVPFLVLMREHNLTPNRIEDSDLYLKVRRYPQIDGLAVAGQATYDFIRDLKLQPPEIMRNTGFPRFDIWTVPTTPGFERPVILFSYFKGYGADAHFIEMMYRFNAAARRHPDIPFIVKAKHRHEIASIEQLVPDPSSNLRVLDALALPTLIKNARVIVGFRSLALYESLLAGAPILVPYWGETAKEPSLLAPGPNDQRLKGYITFYSTPETFKAALEDSILHDRRATNMSGHHAAFAQYVEHSPTQTATARVEQFVADVLAARAAGRPFVA